MPIQHLVSSLTGAVSYRAQVREKGRPLKSNNFTNEADAKERATPVKSAIKEARHFPRRGAPRADLASFVQCYRDNVLQDVRAFSKASREQHRIRWETRFAGRTIGQVTSDLVTL